MKSAPSNHGSKNVRSAPMLSGLLAGGAALLLVGCSHKPVPCQAPPDCDDGHECLAFRCVPHGGEPVPPSSERLVIDPRELASEAVTSLPAYITLGPPDESALYVRFALPKTRCDELDSAFLLLAAPEKGQNPKHPIQISVRRVTEGWDAQNVARGNVPSDGLPAVLGLALPPNTARIDVTSIVCHDLEAPNTSHGLVVRAVDGASPLWVSMGIEAGHPPRLELYISASKRQLTQH